MKQKALHWLSCALLLTGVPAIAEAQPTEVPHTAESLRQIIQAQPELSERVQQLDQLGAWLREGKESQTRAWIRAHREQALSLAEEVYIDVHASPWLALPPQHAASAALLPLLAQELQEPSLSEPLCLDAQIQASPEQCQDRPWREELGILLVTKELQDILFIDELPSVQPGSMLGISLGDKESSPWSQRGKMQSLYYAGLSHGDYSERLQGLLEALHLVRQWRARDLEGLMLLAIAKVLADETSASEAPGFRLSQAEREKLVQDYLAQASQLADLVDSKSLQAVTLSLRALLSPDRRTQDLEQAEALSRSLNDFQMREQLLLGLGDVRVMLSPSDLRVYWELLESGHFVRKEVVQRLIHIGEDEILTQLQQRFFKESDLELKAALIQAFTAGKQSEQLFQLLATENQPRLRLAMVEALAQSLDLDAEDPEHVRKRLLPLALDTDPAIRKAVAHGLMNSDDQGIQRAMLAWIDSPHPELQYAGILAATKLNRKEYLPHALKLLESRDVTVSYFALDAVQAWGSREHISALEALLPQADPDTQLRLKLAISSLKGPQALLETVSDQIATVDNDPYGRMFHVLYLAWQNKKLKPSDLVPWLSHPDPKLQRILLSVLSLSGTDSPELQDTLAVLLESPDEQVREAALQVLGPEAKNAVPALLKLASDPASKLAAPALYHLGRLALTARDRVAFRTLLPKYSQSPRELRLQMLLLWRQWPGPEHTDLLVPWSVDPDKEIRLQAKLLLMRDGTPAQRENLGFE